MIASSLVMLLTAACSGEKEVAEGSLIASTTAFTPCKNSSRADVDADFQMKLSLSLKGLFLLVFFVFAGLL